MRLSDYDLSQLNEKELLETTWRRLLVKLLTDLKEARTIETKLPQYNYVDFIAYQACDNMSHFTLTSICYYLLNSLAFVNNTAKSCVIFFS